MWCFSYLIAFLPNVDFPFIFPFGFGTPPPKVCALTPVCVNEIDRSFLFYSLNFWVPANAVSFFVLFPILSSPSSSSFLTPVFPLIPGSRPPPVQPRRPPVESSPLFFLGTLHTREQDHSCFLVQAAFPIFLPPLTPP